MIKKVKRKIMIAKEINILKNNHARKKIEEDRIPLSRLPDVLFKGHLQSVNKSVVSKRRLKTNMRE